MVGNWQTRIDEFEKKAMEYAEGTILWYDEDWNKFKEEVQKLHNETIKRVGEKIKEKAVYASHDADDKQGCWGGDAVRIKEIDKIINEEIKDGNV